MSKHTPGPWVVTEEGRPYGHISSDPNGYGNIATAWGNHEANARLIAAAPEMLALLKAAHHWMQPHLMYEQSDLREQVEAVIAKAEGENTAKMSAAKDVTP